MKQKFKQIFSTTSDNIKIIFHAFYDPFKQEVIDEAKKELLQEEAFRLHNTTGYLEELSKEELYF
jgi:hypothetical protein